MFACREAQAVMGCPSLGGFKGLGDNAATGDAVNGPYTAGTKFDWLSRSTSHGWALSFDAGGDARQALWASLLSLGYSVQVVYGGAGSVLEITGSLSADRASGAAVRDQITAAAQSAGFTFSAPIQFNVESPLSAWKVGAPGSDTVWGDQTPVPVKNIFNELGLDIAGDPAALAGTLKNVAIYGGIGLLLFVLISRK